MTTNFNNHRRLCLGCGGKLGATTNGHCDHCNKKGLVKAKPRKFTQDVIDHKKRWAIEQRKIDRDFEAQYSLEGLSI